jgi:hypothetical protein
MIEIARDAPGSVAWGSQRPAATSGVPLRRRRTVPFRLLLTSETDRTLIYARPFKCKACGSREVTLFAIDSQAEHGADDP